MTTRRALVVANWKMNGSTAACEAWAGAFKALPAPKAETALCAPAVLLGCLAQHLSQSCVALGAQDVSEYASGAYTGETSASMLRDIGARWVIIGHSERRTLFGDTDARVAAKVRAALACGLKPIVCVGETLAERESSQTLRVVEKQLTAVIDAVGAQALASGAVAYEPVWAIGTGKTATPDEAQHVHCNLRELIARFDPKAAAAVRILYGGSVKPSNAAELFSQPDIDGGLIGGASLSAQDFYAICQAA